VATFGETGDLGSDLGLKTQYATCYYTTLTETASVSKLTARLHDGGGTGYVRGFIAANNGGVPGALTATTSSVQMAGDNSWTLRDLPFATNVELSAGNYWLGVYYDASSENIICDALGSVHSYFDDTLSFPTTLVPATFHDGGANTRFQLYATYTAPVGWSGLTVIRDVSS